MTEVAHTREETLLFRSESFAHKLLSEFSRVVGWKFLHKSVRPLIKQIMQKNLDIEIDPLREENEDARNANRERLLSAAQEFLDSIVESEPYIQLPVREISMQLAEEAAKKFPEAKYRVVGGFVFLRWICPAIVSPAAYSLTQETPDSAQQRRLILIAKLLQNLSNDAYFEKEEYMSSLNGFLDSNRDKLNQFFDALLTTPEEEKCYSLPVHKSITYFEVIAKYLSENYATIRQELMSYSTNLKLTQDMDAVNPKSSSGFSVAFELGKVLGKLDRQALKPKKMKILQDGGEE